MVLLDNMEAIVSPVNTGGAGQAQILRDTLFIALTLPSLPEMPSDSGGLRANGIN
jgi:hypothetical protein